MKMNNKTMQLLVPTDIDVIHGGTLPHMPDRKIDGMRVRVRDRDRERNLEVVQNRIPQQPAPNMAQAPAVALLPPAQNMAQAPIVRIVPLRHAG